MFSLFVFSPITITRALTVPVLNHSRRIFASNSKTLQMGGHQNLHLIGKRRQANFRLSNVSGYVTDVMEIHADEPTLHVLFVPGNPGVISFYTDFLESLYEIMGATASITGMLLFFYISPSRIFFSGLNLSGKIGKNRKHGKLFTLEEQIDHKMHFMEHELKNIDVPLILVGHSIGSYISIEMFRRYPEKVTYCIGLYPFLALNTKSSTQSVLREMAGSPFISVMLGSIVALLGLLPTRASRFLVKKSVGKSWSPAAVEALCTDVLKYHTVRNMLFMAMTEFKKLVEKPDWGFMREKQSKIAFLFGLDDHWGPLQMFDEISKEVPGAVLGIEREGHTHAFSCTEAGSLWVAHYVANLIKTRPST
ncbi:hypothetical protein LguiB_003927 [Lonicera macranthoides]